MASRAAPTAPTRWRCAGHAVDPHRPRHVPLSWRGVLWSRRDAAATPACVTPCSARGESSRGARCAPRLDKATQTRLRAGRAQGALGAEPGRVPSSGKRIHEVSGLQPGGEPQSQRRPPRRDSLVMAAPPRRTRRSPSACARCASSGRLRHRAACVATGCQARRGHPHIPHLSRPLSTTPPSTRLTRAGAAPSTEANPGVTVPRGRRARGGAKEARPVRADAAPVADPPAQGPASSRRASAR